MRAPVPLSLLLLLSLAGSATAQSGEEGPLFGTNETYAYTFETPGTFPYHCHPHPGMKAEVVVTDAEDAQSGTVNVTVQNYEYAPATLRVKPGTTVVWTNLDSEAHTVTFDEGHAHNAVPSPLFLVVLAMLGAAAVRIRRA